MKPSILQMPVMGQRRAVLNRIRSRANDFGLKKTDVRPFCLRLYAELVNDRNSLTFRVDDQTTSHAAEIRLDKSDALFVDRIGLGIHKVLITDSIEEPANTPLIFYPDVNFFTETDEAKTLEALYNSRLSFKTDQDVRLDNFDTRVFRSVPEQQYNAAAAVLGTAAQAVPANAPAYKSPDDYMYDIVTNFGIWGNKRNEVTISLGTGDLGHVAGAATHQNYAVLLLEGFQIVNGAEGATKSALNQLFSDM